MVFPFKKTGRFAVELEIFAWNPALKSRAHEQTRRTVHSMPKAETGHSGRSPRSRRNCVTQMPNKVNT
jgi:hypothetical protein